MRKANVAFIFQPENNLRRYFENSLSDLMPVKLLYPPDEKEETLIEHCREADIIVGWRATEKIIENSKNLSLYIFPGAGAHSVVEIFRKLKRDPMPVLANGHGNSYFTAQGTVALLLALINKIIPHHNWMIEGAWRKGDDAAVSTPLRDRVVGLIGYGGVNQKIHHFLKPYSVEFAICKRDWGRQRTTIPDSVKKYTPQDLDEFFDLVDIVIIAVPLTSMTQRMVKASHLALLGRKGIVVNVARGPVIVEEDLYYALKEQTIAGAALDVWYEYRPEPDARGRTYPFHYPFHTLENVVLSPHRAASPFNDLKRWDEVIENITRFAQGRNDFLNTVDLTAEY